jgi:hypothetical protein
MTKSIAKIKMHYKFPEQTNDRYSYFTCPYNYLEFGEARPILRFAASVSLMGALLRNSEYTRNASWPDLVSITEKSADLNNNLQKEFLDLVLKAQKIYAPLKKKKL